LEFLLIETKFLKSGILDRRQHSYNLDLTNLQKRIKKIPAISISSSHTKLLQYMGIFIIKISCSVATSARGKQEEIQNRGTHKEREGGMGTWGFGFRVYEVDAPRATWKLTHLLCGQSHRSRALEQLSSLPLSSSLL
jgi:hypothetical protein